MYSFHNDIGIPLNDVAEDVLGIKLGRGSIFDRDFTEIGGFLEVMILLLYIKNYYMADDKISDFIAKHKSLLRTHSKDIAEKDAFAVYNEFLILLNELPRKI